jgi:hypothetical protein
MAKKRKRRKRTTSEKVMLVLGVLIALSMILALIAGLGSGHRTGQTPLPENWIEYDGGIWTEVDTSEIPQLSSGPDMALPAPAD